MDTVDNNYHWRRRVSGFNGDVTFSAIHTDPDQNLGAVAQLEGGAAALPERAVVNTSNSVRGPKGQGSDERVLAPDEPEIRKGHEFHKQYEWENKHLNGPAYQTTLFDVASAVPAKPPVLGVLASTVGESHLVPSILGLAGHESMSRFGVMPIPDVSLSKDSARIVQRLVRNGVIDAHPQNPNSEPSNGLARQTDPDFPGMAVNTERRSVRRALMNHMDAKMRGEDPGPNPVTDVDPMVGSQFARARLRDAMRKT